MIKKMAPEKPLILLIDDDTDLVEANQRALKKQGYEVISSYDSSDGLARAKKHHPDLIMLDVALGEEDGIELMKEIKSDASLQDIFVVLISGKEVSPGSVTGGLNAGADEYLIKPLTNKELLAHAGAFIKQKQTIDQLRRAESRFSKLIQQNADAILVLSKKGDIRFANPAAGRLFNMDAESLMGLNFGLPASMEQSNEINIPSKGKEEVIVEMHMAEDTWEDEKAYIATLRDVTERKRAHEQVTHLNSLLKSISKINQIIVEENDIYNIFAKAGNALLENRSYLGITMGLMDESDHLIRPVTKAGGHDFPEDWSVSPAGKGDAPLCVKHALESQELQVISDREFCSDCPHQGKKYTNEVYKVVVSPMVVDNAVKGVVAVTLEKGIDVTGEEEGLLKEVTDDLGLAYKKVKLEKELEQSEKSYRELFEKSPVGIFQTTSRGQVMSVNQEMAYMLGFDQPEEAVSHYNDLKHQLYANPEKRDEFIRLLKEQKRVNAFDYEAYTHDKKKIWIEMDATASKSYSDGSFLIDGFAKDITTEKMAKEKLQASEKRYRELFESIRDAILVADTNRNIIDCNDAFADLFGYTLDELKDRKTYSVYNDMEEFKLMGEAIRNHDSTKNFYYTVNFRKKNGEVFPGETNVFYLRDENHEIYAVVGLIRDISDRVEAYKKIEESEQRFRTIYESSAVGIKTISLDLKIQRANEAYCRFLGYSEEELIGESIMQITHQEDRAEYAKKMNLLAKGEWNSFEMEKRFIRQDGQVVWSIANVFLIKDDKGNPSYFLGNVVDIDKRRKAEDQLRKKIEDYQALNEEYLAQNEEYQSQNEELNQHLMQIRKMNEDLRQTKQKAEESDRLKSAFLANMSHEIRTPMNAIVGFSDLLNDTDIEQEEKDNYVNIIHTKSNQLLQLITDIVDVAKMESGRLEMSPEQVEVNKFMAEIRSVSEMTLENAKKDDKIDLKIHKDQPGVDVNMIIDSNRLSQIINNLVGNAIKFTNEGTIEIGYNIDKDQIIFYVKDNGTGIPEKDQEAIFKRFVRGSRLKDPESNKLYRGTGLGLSIVSELTRLMNGEVTLDSAPGKGSGFYVSFPWTKTQSDFNQKTTMTDTTQNNLKNKKVLLVEDDEDNMAYLEALFRNTGVSLLTAETGEKAVEIAEKEELDLILMDIKLPGMDGYEATQKIRELHPEIPIIAQTAHAMSEDRQKALNSGCVDYISKPLKRSELFPMIKKVMQS